MPEEQRSPIVKKSFKLKGRQGRDNKGVRKFAGTKGKDIPKGEVLIRHGASWLRVEQVEYCLALQYLKFI